MAIRPLRSTLIGLLFFIAGGLALAQRPLNVPNYLLSSIPLLQPNTPVDGQLDRDDGQNFKDGAYLDIYAFDGVADEEVVLLLGSPVLDTYLVLYSPSGDLVDFSDDLPNDSDSGLHVFLPEGGRYLVVVSSFFGGDTGPYTVTRFTPDQAPMEVFDDLGFGFGGGPAFETLPPARILTVPTLVSGELMSSMVPIDIDGWSHYVVTYSFAVGQAGSVSVSMRSNAFDTYLYLFNEFGELIGSNDDDPDDTSFGTDSRITEFLDPGTYTVVATSFFELETGTFDFEVELR